MSSCKSQAHAAFLVGSHDPVSPSAGPTQVRTCFFEPCRSLRLYQVCIRPRGCAPSSHCQSVPSGACSNCWCGNFIRLKTIALVEMNFAGPDPCPFEYNAPCAHPDFAGGHNRELAIPPGSCRKRCESAQGCCEAALPCASFFLPYCSRRWAGHPGKVIYGTFYCAVFFDWFVSSDIWPAVV